MFGAYGSAVRLDTPTFACALMLIVVLGCVPHSPYDRAHLSAALTQRTGHGLRGATGTEQLVPPGIVLTDGITEDEAVAIALWNNATFQADLAALGVARADLVEAGMMRNPIFTLLLPLGPKQLEFTTTIPFEAIWQRPRRIAAAKLDVERVAGNLAQSGLDLVRTAKLSYADAALAADRLALARESSGLMIRILRISEAQLRVGEISQLEVGAVRVEGRRADLEVKRHEREVAARLETFRAVLGIEDRALLVALHVEPPEPRVLGDVEAAVNEALALRPDLRSAELHLEANGARSSWETSRAIPSAGLVVDANGSGSQGFELGPGLTLELPLFNQNRSGMLRADAEIERAQWAYQATRQRISLEVRQGFIRYVQASEGLEMLRAAILPDLEASIRLAEKTFAAGESSLLFILETARRSVEARVLEAETVAELRRAAAELDRGIGRKRING